VSKKGRKTKYTQANVSVLCVSLSVLFNDAISSKYYVSSKAYE